MLCNPCARPSRRIVKKGAKALAGKRRIRVSTAKSLSGSILALSKNAKDKRCSPKRYRTK